MRVHAICGYCCVAAATIAAVLTIAAAHATPAAVTTSGSDASYAPIAGGAFRSILPTGGKEPRDVRVDPYSLRRTPVTNGEFLDFVRAWQQLELKGDQATREAVLEAISGRVSR